MDPVSERLWLPRNEQPDLTALNAFAVDFQLSQLIARILAGREPSLEVARDFLSTRLADLPDPFLLPDMSAAVDRSSHIREEKRIGQISETSVEEVTSNSQRRLTTGKDTGNQR